MTDKESGRVTRPTAIGAGLVALDVVFADRAMPPLGRWAGGTCGNVMTILSSFGWNCYPVARLGRGEEGELVASDMGKWNVKSQFLHFEATGGTPVIIEYLQRNQEGPATHRFSSRCPVCGNRLPSHRAITRDMAQHVMDSVHAADVFFFDRASPGSIRLAEGYASRGAVVMFEPNSASDERLFRRALAASHIVKVSHERSISVKALSMDGPLLVVDTRGADGLRYRSRIPKSRTAKWQSSAALHATRVRDTAGAGDWCSVGIIQRLCAGGLAALLAVTHDELADAMSYAQACAVWSCGYESPRGGMYKCTAGEIRKQVSRIHATKSLPATDEPVRRIARGSSLTSHLCADCRDG